MEITERLFGDLERSIRIDFNLATIQNMGEPGRTLTMTEQMFCTRLEEGKRSRGKTAVLAALRQGA